MRLLIKNAHVVDPDTKIDGIYDILVHNHVIEAVASNIESDADEIIDGEGCVVMPGFIDMHVHLREPGFEYKETIRTGAMAAAAGGFTTICAMPNTNPVIDNEFMVDYVIHKAKKDAVVNVLPVGAITKGQNGQELANIGNMVKEGIVAVSEDGKSVMNTNLYKKAMQYAKQFGIPILAHCEDKELVGKGVMNAGTKAVDLGLPGIGNDVEDVIVARDILMAKATKVPLHLCHCSTADSVAMVKMAKEAGIDVTAEVCPHHFTLTTDDMKDYDTNYKMNPPLRSQADVNALIQGLKDNVMDVIATDHAPHSFDDKNTTMNEAAFGIVGLETAASLTYTELVEKGHITLMQMAEKLSFNPARRLGMTEKGSLNPGKVADIVILDINEEYEIDPELFFSKGKNTPFAGRLVKGKVKFTIVNGKVVYSNKNSR